MKTKGGEKQVPGFRYQVSGKALEAMPPRDFGEPFCLLTPVSRLLPFNNEGDSGDVDENKGMMFRMPGVRRPEMGEVGSGLGNSGAGDCSGLLDPGILTPISRPLPVTILLDLAKKWGKDSAQSLGWAYGEESPQGAADAALQLFFSPGVFPTAPFPQIDHCILASERADRIFMDYGPLFTAMREKNWVLLPQAIRVEDDVAKANLFRVSGGYIVPVVMGGSTPNATVTIGGITELQSGKTIHCELLHPGETEWKACEFTRGDTDITVYVSLRRGCAMVKLRVD